MWVLHQLAELALPVRDERRDRKSGRVWRITAKGHALLEPPKIHGAAPGELFKLLERREYRYRYWAKRELRSVDPGARLY